MKFALIALLLTLPAMAQAHWSTDGEAGIVNTTGNSRAQSYSLKDKTGWTLGKDTYSVMGNYLESQSNGVQTAKNFLLGIRYERALSDVLSAFLAQDVMGDQFAGILQRYNTDLGLKYFFAKREKDLIVSTEGGYRYTSEHTTTNQTNSYQKARLYAEGEKYWSPTVSTKLWAEYVPNFTVSTNWLFNTEASVSAALNSVFSLKTAYLVKYNHAPPVVTAVKTDTVLTTAIGAKF
jgi:putative salt-induced outer membrane protein